MPPLALIDAKTSSLPVVGNGRGGAAVGSRPGGSGGGGRPPLWDSRGVGGAPKDGNGGGMGPNECGIDGGVDTGGPLKEGCGLGTVLGSEGNGGGTGAEGTFR